MADKYIRLNSGQLAEKEATVVSAGAGDAGEIVALDAAGKLDVSVLPTGIGAEVAVVPTSENLSAGNMVNIYDATGTATGRKADASNGRRAHGFVKEATVSPADATVYLLGVNDGLAGLTPGEDYFLSNDTAGAVEATAPSTSGHLVQYIGTAIADTALAVRIAQPITLA